MRLQESNGAAVLLGKALKNRLTVEQQPLLRVLLEVQQHAESRNGHLPILKEIAYAAAAEVTCIMKNAIPDEGVSGRLQEITILQTRWEAIRAEIAHALVPIQHHEATVSRKNHKITVTREKLRRAAAGLAALKGDDSFRADTAHTARGAAIARQIKDAEERVSDIRKQLDALEGDSEPAADVTIASEDQNILRSLLRALFEPVPVASPECAFPEVYNQVTAAGMKNGTAALQRRSEDILMELRPVGKSASNLYRQALSRCRENPDVNTATREIFNKRLGDAYNEFAWNSPEHIQLLNDATAACWNRLPDVFGESMLLLDGILADLNALRTRTLKEAERVRREAITYSEKLSAAAASRRERVSPRQSRHSRNLDEKRDLLFTNATRLDQQMRILEGTRHMLMAAHPVRSLIYFGSNVLAGMKDFVSSRTKE